MMNFKALILLAGAIVLPYIAFAEDFSDINLDEQDGYYDAEQIAFSDPIEPVNRFVFAINDLLDRVIFSKIADAYIFVTPKIFREGVSNALDNMSEPVYFVNNVLQGNQDEAAKNVGRFLTNTILGVGGVVDVASQMDDLDKSHTDFGLTLRKYNFKTGPYIIIPIIGPSSPRDIVGIAADYGINPFNSSGIDEKIRNAKMSIQFIDGEVRNSNFVNQMRSTSLDYYSAIRSMYFQKRN